MMAVLIRSGNFRHKHNLTEWESCEGRDRQAQKEDGHLNVEAEMKVMLPQTEEYLELPKAGRVRKGLSPRSFRGLWSC